MSRRRMTPRLGLYSAVIMIEDRWIDALLDDINIHRDKDVPGIPRILEDLNFCVGTEPASIHLRVEIK